MMKQRGGGLQVAASSPDLEAASRKFDPSSMPGRIQPDAAADRRDLFPVPLLRVDSHAPPEGAVSRCVRRRLLRRDAVAEECNRAIGALNDLAGRPQAPGAPGLAERLPHRLVHERVRRAAVELGPPPPDLSPAGALRELRGAGVYEDLDSPVVSFDDSLVSLPEAGNTPVPLGQLLQDVGDLDVEASIHEQLLRSEEVESNLLAAPRQPYMDTILRSDARAYARLVRRLSDAGMVTYTDSPREKCGLFFARKKSGKQRMVWTAGGPTAGSGGLPQSPLPQARRWASWPCRRERSST